MLELLRQHVVLERPRAALHCALRTYQHGAMRGGWTRRKAWKYSVSPSLTVAAAAAAATVTGAAAAAAAAAGGGGGVSTRLAIVSQQRHHALSFIAPSCTLPSNGRATNPAAPNRGRRLSTSGFGRRPRPTNGGVASLPRWGKRRDSGGGGCLALNSAGKEGEEGATAAVAAAAAATGSKDSEITSSLSEGEGGGGGSHRLEGVGGERQEEEKDEEGQVEDEREKELNEIDHRYV